MYQSTDENLINLESTQDLESLIQQCVDYNTDDPKDYENIINNLKEDAKKLEAEADKSLLSYVTIRNEVNKKLILAGQLELMMRDGVIRDVCHR